MTASRFAVKLPIGTMRDLLLARKAALETEIADRFRAAREHGAPRPAVRTLSVLLRTVKDQLRQVSAPSTTHPERNEHHG